MIESAGQNLVVENNGRRFEAVLRFELPDDAATVFVEAVNITVGGREIDAVVFDRRLTRPGSAAPRIFVQTAAHETSFELPNYFQLTVFDRTGSVEDTGRIAKPHRPRMSKCPNSQSRQRRAPRCALRCLPGHARE